MQRFIGLLAFSILALSELAAAATPERLPPRTIGRAAWVRGGRSDANLGLDPAESHAAPVAVAPGPRMSDAVVFGGLVYTAGVVCEVGGENKDVRQQTMDALDELDRVLAVCRSDKHHILSMQAWVADMGSIGEMNEVYDAWVSKHCPPGRACVESKLVPPYKVEFKVIAAQMPEPSFSADEAR